MKMTNKARASRMALAAVLAALFAGCAATVAATALAIPASPAGLYLAALTAVALCGIGALSGPGAIVAAALFAVTAGGWAAGHTAGLGAIRELFAAWSGQPADAARAALGGATLLTCGAFTLGALFFALLDRREFVSLAILLLLGALVCSHAMSATASLAATVPGLVAAAAAFALTGGLQRDLSALRVLVPSLLAVLLALALIPGEGTTWPPLERAAERVRSAFEQYFRFTQERIAFSINEEGYDHAGEVGDSVVSMLGGPADPHTDPVMAVHTDADVLLRGAIRTTYTGYSWVDLEAKNRYLYYDLTHRSTRDRVFSPSAALQKALLGVDVSVEMLGEGTSTLFVPGLLERFEMDLSTAVYYNTAGEMFLSRQTRPGDRYRLRALLPEMNDALREAVIRGEESNDDRYPDLLERHTQLPEGIDGGVYALTMQVVQGADNPWDRAVAIMNYLRGSMRYTLKPEVPPRGRDFVSHFLLDTREGYCSYYATAMAVMGRIAGLPTRYVEGYLARPGVEVLTGENAHAWAEVYFRGVGWIPFDATGGTTGGGRAPQTQGGTGSDAAGDGGLGEAEGDYDGPGEGPTPSPEPDLAAPEDPAPTPTPEPGESPDDGDESPEDAGGEAPESDDGLPDPAPSGGRGGRGGRWLAWLLLPLLAAVAAALAAYRARRRLRETDPARLCGGAKSYRQAAMILYRANLTVLAHLGQTPAGGETPEAFAARVCGQVENPDFADFARAVAAVSYGRMALRREDIDAGLRAYDRFCKALGRREKLRFTLTRLTKGLGDFTSIP